MCTIVHNAMAMAIELPTCEGAVRAIFGPTHPLPTPLVLWGNGGKPYVINNLINNRTYHTTLPSHSPPPLPSVAALPPIAETGPNPNTVPPQGAATSSGVAAPAMEEKPAPREEQPGPQDKQPGPPPPPSFLLEGDGEEREEKHIVTAVHNVQHTSTNTWKYECTVFGEGKRQWLKGDEIPAALLYLFLKGIDKNSSPIDTPIEWVAMCQLPKNVKQAVKLLQGKLGYA